MARRYDFKYIFVIELINNAMIARPPFLGAVSAISLLQGAHSHWTRGLSNAQPALVPQSLMDVPFHIKLLLLWGESYWALSHFTC